MKRLRTEVERVVAPLHASPWRKDRMREELLAHLGHLYDEELSRYGDPSRALEAARDRFGDSAELARNLQGAVPVAERVLYYSFPGGGWKVRRANESAVAHILRTSRHAAVYVAASNVALIGLVIAISTFASRRPVPQKPPLVNVAAFLALCGLVQIVCMTVLPLCCELVHRQAAVFRGAKRGQRMRPAALVVLGLLTVTATGSAAAALVVGTFGPLVRIPIVNVGQIWAVIAVVAALTLLLSVIQSWQQARAAREFDDLYGEPKVAE